MRAAELEVLLTANTQQVAKAEREIKATGQRIEGKPIEAKVNANAKPALEGMEEVEEAAKRIVSAKTVARIESDIEDAEAGAEKIREELDYLRALSTDVQVDADIAKAEDKLQRTERTLDGLRSARATMTVDADTSDAESEVENLADDAEDTLDEGGSSGGAAFGKGIIAGLATIPIVGAVAKIGEAAVEGLIGAFQDGLQVEVRQDRLQALTGISEEDAARFGRIASEAYTQGYGESAAENMDTARVALQGGLLDVDGTRRDSQRVIESLAGIADVLGEDVAPVSTAVTTMLRAGLIKSSQEGFDILAAGAREGVNAQEDLLDTFIEYPALFSRLGLSGDQALGLVNQGLRAGARNSDLAADALKEFQIRATDGSEASAEGFKTLGLNAEKMTKQIAEGGDGAREGLDTVLDKLREIEDPVKRNAAAVALFGTQAEDLGDALFAMDVSTAVEGLNGVQGAAQKMFDTIASNDASQIETAKRNIEVAAEGIKGALAGAFADPLAEGAEWISQNRGPLLEFFKGLANGAFDFGDAVIEGMAAGTESIGVFVSGPLADLVEGFADTLESASLLGPLLGVLGPDLPDPQVFRDMADGMRGFETSTEQAADEMRTNLGGALDSARERFNGFIDPEITSGYLHDATLRLATAVDEVGYSADGAKLSLEGYDGANLSTAASGAELESQIRSAISAMGDEVAAAAAAGEGQDALTQRYQSSRQALQEQLTAMGLTEDQARALIDTYSAIPETESTDISSNANERSVEVDGLATKVRLLPDGTVEIDANTADAKEVIDRFVSEQSRRTIRMNLAVNAGGGGAGYASMQHDGSVLMPMAGGGTLTPMAPIAQTVDPNTWRIVGDRMTHREFYIPDDGSPRSRAILAEAMRSFGMQAMAAGGALSPGGGARGFGGVVVHMTVSDSKHALSTAYAVKGLLEQATDADPGGVTL
ncbi:phage tail tape measure protein [Litorihabitans aurantiacus]|uniref:Phage tail tape measure protein domain-containing protein n=1 Tax=Litorihabitans aurantiacus TaxID=1930061 RepID=A0AA38CVN9_9MICO|nr:phage tail tape measure protein [Litorihabitans aurantiacus]GMA33504.1 hypothetical protein GCM10025875_34960 [Litorihabitans aurantiacus]GMA33591.1 hypothetical protein GCM10025875_35830 [Litorihabitans aurantiacus]